MFSGQVHIGHYICKSPTKKAQYDDISDKHLANDVRIYDYLKLTGLDSEAVLRPFFEDFFPDCSSLAMFSFPISDFFSADTYTNNM